jgi:GNAT superfamily N-acetyltransferase
VTDWPSPPARRGPLSIRGDAVDVAFGVRAAGAADIPAVKSLLDAHRHELGFVPVPALHQALERGWFYVAVSDHTVVGMIEWWARRDHIAILYHIVVAPTVRKQGVGRGLLHTMVRWARHRGMVEIRLKCPVDLPSNAFYARMGFRLTGCEPGRRRPLNCWVLTLGEGHGDEVGGR